MPNPHRRGITVPITEWDRWQDLADQWGYTSRSSMIRDAVDQFIKRRENNNSD